MLSELKSAEFHEDWGERERGFAPLIPNPSGWCLCLEDAGVSSKPEQGELPSKLPLCALAFFSYRSRRCGATEVSTRAFLKLRKEAAMRLIVVNASLWLIIASTALTLGCRGSVPFGRTVQITKSSDAAEISIDSPEQRLATGKSGDLKGPVDQEQQVSEE